MKVLQKRGKNEGSALLIALAIVTIIGIGLGSYLMLARSQHVLVAESQAWNTALTLAEGGIEEGMAQVNVVFGTNYPPSAATNWGWGGWGSPFYGPRTSVMTNGSYAAIIIPGTPYPTIISTGYTTVPLNSQPIQRIVKVTTTNTPAFSQAMAVQLDIDTKGNGMMVDSYDSSDPAHSTPLGLYNPSNHLAGGDVCSLGGLVNVQNATIYGKLRTGPAGSYNIGNGQVGDLNWSTKGAIEPGWYFNDFNMLFKDVQPPFTSGFGVNAVNIGTNTYMLGPGDYYVNGDFTLNQNETLWIGGNVRLYVTGTFNMKSQNACFITIADGASLQLYVGTADTSSPASATLTQVNTAGNAGSFQYYGLPSNNSVTWNGNNVYVGTVYAPEADFKAGGGGSTDLDWQGACVVNNLTLNGHFNFHYDQNLTRYGPITGYVINSWTEL